MIASVKPFLAGAEIHHLRDRLAALKSQIAGETRAREQAQAAERAACVRADRAEHAERQLAAELGRWKRLALAHEAELRSLAPRRETA